MTNAELAATSSNRLASALSAHGWEVMAVEINAVTERAYVQVRRHDGLHVTLAAEASRGHLVRERHSHTQVTVGRRGDRFIADRVTVELVGRDRVGGWRSGLRALSSYIADNTPALPAAEVRRLFAPMMA